MSKDLVSVKDDTALFEAIERGQELRRALGIPEPTETQLTDSATARREWQRMQQARTAPWTYYVVIEYKNGAYHAHALSFPEVTAQGETVEAVKESIAEALQVHFATLHAEGKAVPFRENRRVEAVEVQSVEHEVQWQGLRAPMGGISTMNETIVLDKDDRDLVAMVERGKEMRREKGIAEPREEFDTRQATREWRRMQQARTAPWTYYVVIEYRNGAYHAHALSFPEVTAQGETVEAVKEDMAQALQAHFTALRARGEAVPTREYKRVDTVEVSSGGAQEALQIPSPSLAPG